METKTTPGPPGEEKFEKLHDLLQQAELSVDEVVPLFEVSRVSIYDWMRKKRGPQQPLIRTRALRVIDLIAHIVKAGDLPLKEVPTKDRHAVLERVFRKHVAVTSARPTQPPKD